jgi:2-oxoglutarate dehydrogenase E1 component
MMYGSWKNDPQSVHASWHEYFTSMDSLDSVLGKNEASETACREAVKALLLMRGYQSHGYILADLDPLRLHQNVTDYTVNWRIPGMIQLKNYGYTEADLDKVVDIGSDLLKGFGGGKTSKFKGRWRLRDLLSELQSTYCGRIGFDYMHIPYRDECNWIRDRIETKDFLSHTRAEKKKLLETLTKSCLMEEFFHTKFATHKRFGLDGLENLINTLEAIIEQSVKNGVDTFIIGMPHRGRLNVMANVLGTSLDDMLGQFLGTTVRLLEEGDVKYHHGTTVQRTVLGKKVTISLLANPSHLEAVAPVAVGKTRAIQNYQKDYSRSLCILIHGDAALAGQGVVYETLQMGDLFDYTTRGTVHIVANNNIGFTTSPRESRSTQFCTEVAKSMGAPVFHVNGESPEEIDFVGRLAADWRREFSKDVFIDLIGYRRYGHNELDEPLFTQPKMYQLIQKRLSAYKLYAEQLISQGVITDAEFQEIIRDIKSEFESAYDAAKTLSSEELSDRYKTYSEWTPIYIPETDLKKTGVDADRLKELGFKMTQLPEELNAHPQIKKIYMARQAAIERGTGIDWATAEALAWASLLVEDKIHVRISGQDVERGTFSHRHAVIHDQVQDMKRYFPLCNLDPNQAEFVASNSHLSEYAVLGFEYGYSIANPNALVMWEAQFGDFANGAQIIIDQFIAAGEAKWGQQTGLVMLLPHGYDGQGAEHSNARPGRFLQLASDHPTTIPWELLKERNQPFASNLQLVNLTTPANYFHFLRRQIRRDFRKPLIVMSPKRLLRHKACVSDLADFTVQRVWRTIDDSGALISAPDKISKVILCSGQVYYDLVEERTKRDITNIAIVRIEQISPFPFDHIQELGGKYAKAKFEWVQEEPLNLGCWEYVKPRINTSLTGLGHSAVQVVARQPQAAAATGYMSVHQGELARLLEQAMQA